jgi:hypothetical protein
MADRVATIEGWCGSRREGHELWAQSQISSGDVRFWSSRRQTFGRYGSGTGAGG